MAEGEALQPTGAERELCGTRLRIDEANQRVPVREADLDGFGRRPSPVEAQLHRLRGQDPHGLRTIRAGELQVAGVPALQFRLRLDGLLGFIAPQIDVAYDARSRRLLRFEGLSNLRDARGDKQMQVRIDFPEGPRPVPGNRWASALSEALVARCDSGQAADSPAARTP